MTGVPVPDITEPDDVNCQSVFLSGPWRKSSRKVDTCAFIALDSLIVQGLLLSAVPTYTCTLYNLLCVWSGYVVKRA